MDDEPLITLEFNEHDAYQILKLIKKEINRSDEIWQPFWEHQAWLIEQAINDASAPNEPDRQEKS